MTARPTIADVARVAGVSKGAVSFALNDRPGVARETRERILAVARELGWTPRVAARALSVSQALALGLVIARPPETLRADPFFPTFIAGIEGVLSEHGFALLLQVILDPAREEESYRRLAEQGRVDGVFLTDLRIGDSRPGLLAEIGLPAVAVGPDVEGCPLAVVCVDDRPGISAAVQHLLDLGHRRIAHVAGPSTLLHGCTRRQAWSDTLRAAGVPEGPCVISDFSAESGAKATIQLLDLAEPPTAIVYANDVMAVAGLSLAIARGVDVPGQLSVVGYDDTEIAAHLRPSLTTVSTDVVGWGQAAAVALLHMVQGRPDAPRTLPDPTLVVRESSGPPPTPLRLP